ncbi:dipeptide epimerase [Candidatus Marinimicrobia bacterium MT.SAG.3]|nr:dipeptide epimerase [Candidatus Marinimicrobia bacterium MT.SAG.3]
MKAKWKEVKLNLIHPFTIARGTRTHYDSIILTLEHNSITAYGEAVPTARYDEDAEKVKAALASIDFESEPFDDPFKLEDIDSACRDNPLMTPSAIAAMNIAYWDLQGKLLGQPLYRLWGLNPLKSLISTFTIGIDEIDVIKQKVREAEIYPILKVKQGLDNDREIISAIRELTDKPIRVDANEGWTKEEALEKIEWLSGQNVEFIEQPLPADKLDESAWLKERSPLPIVADENSMTKEDIPKIAHAFDGINIKLMKCGGPTEALKMIHTARSFGLKIMLGCMCESSIAIGAAAHLSPLADWADLDGNLLLSNDPYRGIDVKEGKLLLPDRPGIGVEPIGDDR